MLLRFLGKVVVHFGTLWHQTELQGLAFGVDKWCLGPALPPSWPARNRFGSHQAVVRIRFGYQGSVSGGGPRLSFFDAHNRRVSV